LVASHSLPAPSPTMPRTLLSSSAIGESSPRTMRAKPPLPMSARDTPPYQVPTQKVPTRSAYSAETWLSPRL